ncbi:hypothetical protein H072_4453 [Dactylellina haptotyla CBS 200.50]|uniref:endo-1,4-beta-xylanase n=1 Tax=Dactylellina haptotyla (strain CBS 200.50) TaxID=1284197 RepID=S8AF15_DACHA|nr:hypothetical protein H072_4453 [Dactylellina haptotyla CBS 200.50]
MPSFIKIILAASAVLSATASPVLPDQEAAAVVQKRNTANQQGTNNGYFYQFWSDGGGTVNYSNGPGGEYSVTWSKVGDFTSGKGWSQAAPRNISFSGTFNPGTNSYLAVYTWSQQGETYILENFGQYNPGSAGTHQGTLVSDGGTYDVYMVNRGNNYIQYWSIRQQKRSSGIVTTANHYNWYSSHGLTHNPNSAAAYQIVSTEGYGSTGSADITVGEVGSTQQTTTTTRTSSTVSTTRTSSTVSPTTTSKSGGTPGGAAQWGQCGGIGWTGPTSCVSPYTCKYSNAAFGNAFCPFE